MNSSEIEVIVKYEINKVIDRLIKQAERYDCSTHQEDCAKRGKSPDECKGAQATAKIIIDILRDWDF